MKSGCEMAALLQHQRETIAGRSASSGIHCVVPTSLWHPRAAPNILVERSGSDPTLQREGVPPPGLEYLLRDNQCPKATLVIASQAGITWSSCPSGVRILLPAPTQAVLPEFVFIKGAAMAPSTFQGYSFHTVQVLPPKALQENPHFQARPHSPWAQVCFRLLEQSWSLGSRAGSVREFTYFQLPCC